MNYVLSINRNQNKFYLVFGRGQSFTVKSPYSLFPSKHRLNNNTPEMKTVIWLPPPDRAFQLLSVILPTRVVFLSFIALSPSFVLIHLLKASDRYFLSFGNDFYRVCFASSFISSFPVNPECPGTHHSATFPFRLFMSCLIFLVLWFFLWLFPDAAIMVHHGGSVNITPLTPVVLIVQHIFIYNLKFFRKLTIKRWNKGSHCLNM
jgi:hypothetical protein